MKSTALISEDQLIAKAIDALIDRLGVVEANRFLALAARQHGDSVRRHRAWQRNLDKDAFFDEVFGRQG